MLGQSCVLHDSLGALVPPGATIELPVCVVDGCEEKRDSRSQLCDKHRGLLLSVEQGLRRREGPAPAAPKQYEPLMVNGPLVVKSAPRLWPPLAPPSPLPLAPIDSGHNYLMTQSGFAWKRPAV